MKRLFIFCSLVLIWFSLFAQPEQVNDSIPDNQKSAQEATPDSLNDKAEMTTIKRPMQNKLFMVRDTLTLSDYMMSIERVNDHLNSIRDSARLTFEVVGMSRRIDEITNDVSIIRESTRGRYTVINIKNLYLYQNLASNLSDENSRIQAHIYTLFNRVYHAKLQLKTVFSDSVFVKLRSDNVLRNKLDDKLYRIERKWMRNDSTIRSNIDSLNSLKVKIADNSVNLSNMLNIMDLRLDRAGHQLFGPEVNYLWQNATPGDTSNVPSRKITSILGSEQKAIGFYFSHTKGERALVYVLGFLLFIWLFGKRKLLKSFRNGEKLFDYIHLQYLTSHPVLSVVLLVLCLMPFFDAYAATSYIACEHILLLTVASIIFFNKRERIFWFDWMALVILFVSDAVTYVLIEPTFAARLWLLMLHSGIIVFSSRFIRNLSKQTPWYKWIKMAAITGIFLSGLGILCNLTGRFSLSGIFGFAGIFAVTQAIVLPVFVEIIIEFILLQLQSSRLKKGVEQPFDTSLVINKIKKPLILIAAILWFIMLTSNLNIYNSLSTELAGFLTTTRTIGSISYKLISVLWFFVIIWIANILQRLISLLFGETGSETEDMTPTSKKQHSRLLITRLLVLIGGYLLAIAASGLPLDKLTIVLGALGVGVGMGLQNVVNNFVSGIILIFDGSLQIGDQIEINGQAGKVKEIGLRASTVSTADGAEVIIPNGNILSQNITNWTYSNDEKRVILRFSLSGKELDTNVINEVINGTIPKIPHVISKRKPVILYSRVTQGTLWITVRFWSTINYADHTKSEAMLQLNNEFAARNFEFK